jgi:hypothetical protein
LRKPDFQRETSEWAPQKVADLINSFLNQDLIPSIILWKGQGYTFVIDGAHRLSALIAWVQDDYGNGTSSQPFFGYDIPPEQAQVAKKTKDIVASKVGSLVEYQSMMKNPQGAPDDKLHIAQNLATLTVPVLWVPGDALNAERSFFKINESASEINETEKRLINSRKKPNGIATRAILQSGTGHEFWNPFSEETKSSIVSWAKEINVNLFTPK